MYSYLRLSQRLRYCNGTSSSRSDSGQKETKKQKQVISMALYGSLATYTLGAIRNAQLARLFFPDWTLRFYVPASNITYTINTGTSGNGANGEDTAIVIGDRITLNSADDVIANKSSSSTNRTSRNINSKNQTLTNDKLLVPERILRCLQLLGAQVVRVATPLAGGDHVIPPALYSWLVADDETVDVFIIRHPHHRLTTRDSAAVDAWLLQPSPSPSSSPPSVKGQIKPDIKNSISNSSVVHCMRDLTSHTVRPIVGGLWGARRVGLRALLGGSSMSQAFLQHVMSMPSLSSGLPPSAAVAAAPLANVSTTAAVSDAIRVRARNVEWTFIDNKLWPAVRQNCLCHDSVSARNRWPNAVPFPLPLADVSNYREFVGQAVDAFGARLG
jgi:hypothetical protein